MGKLEFFCRAKGVWMKEGDGGGVSGDKTPETVMMMGGSVYEEPMRSSQSRKGQL